MRVAQRFVVRREGGLWAYERALERAGLTPVAGADEAGRGACAGPLVVAAVVLPTGRRGQVPGLADSKLLTPAARDRVYDEVVRRAVSWSAVVVPAAGGRPDRAARVQRRGDAPGAGPARRGPGLRADRRVPDPRPAGAGAGGLEGRPGQRVDRGRVGRRQGHPGPDHVGAARALPDVRLPRAQGLHHPGAQRGPRRARPLPRAPVLLRQRRAAGARRPAGAGAHTGRGSTATSRVDVSAEEVLVG